MDNQFLNSEINKAITINTQKIEHTEEKKEISLNPEQVNKVSDLKKIVINPDIVSDNIININTQKLSQDIIDNKDSKDLAFEKKVLSVNKLSNKSHNIISQGENHGEIKRDENAKKTIALVANKTSSGVKEGLLKKNTKGEMPSDDKTAMVLDLKAKMSGFLAFLEETKNEKSDSKEFTDVISITRRLNADLEGVTGTEENYPENLTKRISDLHMACTGYISKNRGFRFTIKGRSRQKNVARMLNYLNWKQDKLVFLRPKTDNKKGLSDSLKPNPFFQIANFFGNDADNSVDELLKKDIRIPKNLSYTNDSDENPELSIEKTKEDTEQIDRLLNQPVSVLEKYSVEKLSLLKVIQGRNKAHLLINNTRAKGKEDSDEMKDVKESLLIVENLLSEKEKFIPEEDIDKLQGAYASAINASRIYLKEKNPKTKEGLQRRAMVEENLRRLNEEIGLLNMGASLMMVQAEKSDMVKSPRDLFILASYHQSKDDMIRNSEVKDVAAAYSLTYDDFLALVGTKNRGNVTFSDGKIKIIKNSAFAQSGIYKTASLLFGEDEVPTVANRHMKERFYELCRERLNENEENGRNQLDKIRKLLGLNSGATTSLSLERSTIAQILGEVNVNGSKYIKIINTEPKETDSAEKKAELSQLQKLADDSLDFLNGKNLEVWEPVNMATPSDEIILSAKTKINETLKKASKLGVKGASLSTHQMDNILNTNIMAFVDKRIDAVEKLYKYAKNITKDEKIDIAEYLKNNSNVSEKLSALVLLRMAAENEEQRNYRQVELDSYIKEVAFTLAEEGDKGIYEAAGKMNIHLLAHKGSEGLFNMVNDRLYEIPDFKGARNMTKVKKGTELLMNLCDNLEKLTALQDKALEEGLSTKNTELMKSLGENIQNSLIKENIELMDFVVKEFQDSRFFEGFSQVKSLLASNYSFSTSANRLAEKFNNPSLDQNIDDNKVQKNRTYSADEKISLLNDNEKAVVNLLRMEDVASAILKGAPDNTVNLIKELKNTLRGIPKGKICYRDINLLNVNAKLVQKEDNSLHVIIGHHAIPVGKKANQIANAIEEDMLMHAEDLYGEDFVNDTLKDLNVSGDNQGDLIRSRNLCIKYLSGKFKKPEAFFVNISSKKVKEMALNILHGIQSPENYIDQIEKIERSNPINGEETKELLKNIDRLTGFFGQDYSDVNMPVNNEINKEQDEEGEFKQPEWTKEEKQVVDFISDLIFARETWFEDYKSSEKPGLRMKSVIESNAEALAELITNPQILKKILDDLPVVDEKTKNEIYSEVNEMLFSEESPITQFKLKGNKKTVAANIKIALKLGENNDAMLESLANLENVMDKLTKDCVEDIQKMITKASGEIFNNNPAPVEQAEANLTPAEKLDKMVKDTLRGNEGSGKFMKTVLSNYFKEVSTLDMRTMLASAIRNSKPKIIRPENATPEQLLSIEKKEYGNTLGGFLKGAGPLLQKELQGIPDVAIPLELQVAIKDMKSNLAPIPEKIVKAQMQNIVDRSGGNITRIKVDKALGAASVGQTFLCTLFGPQMGKKGKEVVVKLLRPDVRNRMMREKDIMIHCARMTDGTENEEGKPIDVNGNPTQKRRKGGMEATYEGKLLRIEEELDLTIEAKNAEKGALYDRGFSTVKSMKVDNSVEPTTNCLVLEKAPGTTVDSYMNEVKKLNKDLKDKYITTGEDQKEKVTKLNPANSMEFIKDREMLKEFIESLKKRQSYLSNLTESWVTEGIYGNGFYHGDLHSGNIMIDEKGVTLIDFGNATSLSPIQKKHIIKIMIGAATGSVDIFEQSFHALMENTSEEYYDSKKSEFKAILNEILSLGGRQETGQKIMAALSKSQTLGLELPPAIFNFSQSQIRLQNTLDNVNDQIKKLGETLKLMEECEYDLNTYGDDPLLRIMVGQKKGEELIELINNEMRMQDQSVGEDIVIKDLEELKTTEFEYKYFEESQLNYYVPFNNAMECLDKLQNNNLSDKDYQTFELGVVSSIFSVKPLFPRNSDYNEFVEKLQGLMDEKTKESIQKAIDMINDLRYNSPVMALLKAYQDYDKMRKENKPEETLLAKKKFLELRGPVLERFTLFNDTSTLNQFGKYIAVYANEDNREKIDALMKTWYESDDLSTEVKENVKAKFEAYKNALINENSTEKDYNTKRDEFILAMRPALLERLKQAKAMLKPDVKGGDPDSFMNAMNGVLVSNLRKSVNMLGKWTAFKLTVSNNLGDLA